MCAQTHYLMKYFYTLLFIFCSTQYAFGQGYLVKGTVSDTLNVAPLPRASVVLIRTKDSVIEKYSRTTASGSFELSAPAKGKYILRISFPSFADYSDVINVDQPITDVGQIAMVSKENLLKEFVLTKQIAAIKIKGDTTEFVADSFKVKEGANVEDLLKRLPGLSVDKNGTITAQGETVQKILVDGEEFFSDDPKVVTQGLQANAIDKVQVYDKKSDQAQFTGIDDGQKVKTINLQLKEDRKKGYFGKMDAGAGTDGYFQNQAMINAFKGKRQLSGFGIVSNTDKVGLGWQDNGKFGSGNDMGNEDGMITIQNDRDENFGGWDGNYRGQGLPKVWTGGLHYADKWKEEMHHVASNYRYARQQVEIDGNSTVQNGLKGDTTNVSNTHSNQFSRGDRNALDFTYDLKLDTNNSFKITLGGGTKTSEASSTYHTITTLRTAVTDDGLYHADRTIRDTTNADFINANVLFKKKFAKKGRTLSIDFNENYKESVTNEQLKYGITYDTLGAKESKTDQHKIYSSYTMALGSKATYTEPLSKVSFLEFNYGLTVNNSLGKNDSRNNEDGSRDALHSSDFKYNVLTNSGGVNFKYAKKKMNFSFGSDLSRAAFTQTDRLNGDTSYTHNYINVMPKASFKYRESNQSSFSLNYSGYNKQPTLNQVQPLLQNTDPSNITIGNPNLKQEFVHSTSFTINKYTILTHKWLWVNGGFKATTNAISTSQRNSDGINTTQYVNVDGNYSGWFWAGGGFKLPKPDLNVGVHFNPNINHSTNFINGIKNINDNSTYNGGLQFSYYKDDKYNFDLSPDVVYNVNKATISTYTTNYWSGNVDFNAWVQLTKKFVVGSDVDFIFREATPVFQGITRATKWNAHVGKKFLKKNELELRLYVIDILNQNVGFDRNATGSIITQNNYNTIRRYCMLNLIWNFTHKPSGDAEPQ